MDEAASNSVPQPVRPPEKLESLLGEADAKRIVDFRHDLHCHPEIGMETVSTADKVEAELRAMGFTDIRRFAKTGLAARLQGEKPGPMIGIRADMDALPAPDETGLPWASQQSNCAHLCGHDGHTAGLLAAALWFSRHPHFAGEIVFIFQPGEEGWSGAKKMIDDGLFKAYPCREVYAMHCESRLPIGSMKMRRGAMTANADIAKVTMEGCGGHGARPHQTIDPVPAIVEFLSAVPTIVSRNIDAMKPAVLSPCWIAAGDENAPTVIPQRARCSVSVRTFDRDVQDTVEKRLREAAQGAAQMFGCRADFSYEHYYPSQVNNAALVDALEPALKRVFGDEAVLTDFSPSMGSEDFAFMSQCVPGVYIQFGMVDKDHCGVSAHNPHFDFNDAVLGAWLRALITIVETRLPL